jgi:hypothetical protein
MSKAVQDMQSPEVLKQLGIIKHNDNVFKAQPKPVKYKMSKTEIRYLNEVLKTKETEGIITHISFTGVTFRMSNGHRYTPDFSFLAGDKMTFVEVKGSYRLGSYQRAKLAFDQAKLEWPMFNWIWVELQKDGSWHNRY